MDESIALESSIMKKTTHSFASAEMPKIQFVSDENGEYVTFECNYAKDESAVVAFSAEHIGKMVESLTRIGRIGGSPVGHKVVAQARSVAADAREIAGGAQRKPIGGWKIAGPRHENRNDQIPTDVDVFSEPATQYAFFWHQQSNRLFRVKKFDSDRGQAGLTECMTLSEAPVLNVYPPMERQSRISSLWNYRKNKGVPVVVLA